LKVAAISIFFCFLAALCEGFDVQAAGVAGLGLSQTFAPTPEQLGLFFSAGNAGLLLGAIIGGRLADRFGRKIVLVCSIGIFGLFSLATSQASSMESLTWMRAVTGLGLGGSMPNLIALASEVSTAQSRNAKVAITYIGMPLGGAIASLVVLLLTIDQWRWIFVIGGFAPLLIAASMAMWLPASPVGASRQDTLIDSAPPTAARRELFGRERLLQTMLLWAGFFLMQLTFQLVLNWLPLLLQARGLAKGVVATAQIGFNAGGATGALLLGMLLDTRAARPSISAAVVALPIVLLLLANAPDQAGPVIALAMLVGGSGLAYQIILYGVANHVYPSSARGAGLGAAVAVGRAGAIVGPAFGALLLGAGRSSQQVLVGVLPVAIVCGLCVVALGWWAFREQGRAAEVSALEEGT
jgi:MFS transporter, AAHS family, 3-hydroxyphenylpropionic acid transporter